jgi:hypothetical protein
VPRRNFISQGFQYIERFHTGEGGPYPHDPVALLGKELGDLLKGFLPRKGITFCVDAGSAVFVVFFVVQAAFIAHPVGIDLEVFPRGEAHHEVVSHPHIGVASLSAACADGRGVVHFPGSGFEAVVSASEGAHRADIYGIEGVGVVKGLPMRRKGIVAVAPLDHGELVGFRDFAGEAHASGAVDAPFGVQHDVGAEGEALGLVDFFQLEAGAFGAVLVGPDLKGALAGLVADRAVQRVIDEDKLQDRLLGAGYGRGGAMRAHMQVGYQVGRARRRRFRSPLNAERPVRLPDILSCLTILHGEACFYETHAAVCGDTQRRMIAEKGYLNTIFQAKLEELHRLLVGVGLPVYVDGRHIAKEQIKGCRKVRLAGWIVDRGGAHEPHPS